MTPSRLPFKNTRTVSSTTSTFPIAMAPKKISADKWDDVGMVVQPQNPLIVKDEGNLGKCTKRGMKLAVIFSSLFAVVLVTSLAVQIWHGVKSDRSFSKLQQALYELSDDTNDHQPKDITSNEDGKTTDHWNVTGLQDCVEYRAEGYSTSGLYHIHPPYGRPTGYVVYCDMDTDGGGWIVFQRRVDGSVYFYKNWLSYQHGFGNASHEFWIADEGKLGQTIFVGTYEPTAILENFGNDVLHNLTSFVDVRLRVDMWAWNGEYAYAEYSNFSIKAGHYQLVFGDFLGGPAGDGLERQKMKAFSTYDNVFEEHNRCPQRTFSAWWYEHCYRSNLNGPYNFDETPAVTGVGLIWRPWKGDRYSLRKTEMKFRRTK